MKSFLPSISGAASRQCLLWLSEMRGGPEAGTGRRSWSHDGSGQGVRGAVRRSDNIGRECSLVERLAKLRNLAVSMFRSVVYCRNNSVKVVVAVVDGIESSIELRVAR